MAHVVTEHGFVATGGGGSGSPVTNGYGTSHPNSLTTGVNVSATQTGVIGTGVTGVQGQGLGAQTAAGIGVQGQGATALQPTVGSTAPASGIGVQGGGAGGNIIGVQGTGDVFGVKGENVGNGPGVLGTSMSGIGIFGAGAGNPDQNSSVPPYIGVYGQAQAEPVTASNTIQNNYLATGVLGIGDRYGGAFQSTPIEGDDPYANIQLSPMALEFLPPNSNITVQDYAPNPLTQEDPITMKQVAQIQQLASKGQPGDIAAVQTTDGDNKPSVELWICIRPSVAIGERKIGATWARIHFDNYVTMPTPSA